MKLHALRVALVACLACSLAALAGCRSYEPASDEAGALSYYQGKYGVSTTVAEQNLLGSYGLFGYTYEGAEYIMADGSSVVYLDDEGVWRDNRQDAEIQEAARLFAQRKLDAIPAALAPPAVVQVGDGHYPETYKGSGECWATRYDGDIKRFLRAEWPALVLEGRYSEPSGGEGRYSYDAAYDAAQADGLDAAYLDLGRYYDIRNVALAVADADAFAAGPLSLFDEGLECRMTFAGEDAGSLEAMRFKPVFVPLFDGATISSGTPGVTLRAGDVRFEDRGDGFFTCRIAPELAGRDMTYYIWNDAGKDIVQVVGLDRFREVCASGQHTEYGHLSDGGTYFLGPLGDIAPRIELQEVTADKVTARYHTHFKDQINHVSLTVIGMAVPEGKSGAETTAFDARIVKATDDGWICEVAIPENAKPDSALYFQFAYNGDSKIVQLEERLAIPAR